MLTPKGKQSLLRVSITYVGIALILIGGGIAGLLVWRSAYPGFHALIMCLIALIVAIVGYFILLRGVFLNHSSGYSLDEKFFIIKDGYPNAKQICILTKNVEVAKVKRLKDPLSFGLGKMVIYVSGKKYVLKNVSYDKLCELKARIEEYGKV